MSQACDTIRRLSSELEPGEAVLLAACLLEDAGVNQQTVEALKDELSAGDWFELVEAVDSLRD